MGERDSLWDVIVNNDDICFKHILPRLNRTDVKFLYEVNTETRKLIKRSSRMGDLKKKFNVNEMSSISTLEFAWENKSLWRSWWGEGETFFCSKVAKTNKLELLKWAREEKECEWHVETINAVAEHGNLEMLKYCVANECPMDEMACGIAAEFGHLECLKYLHEEAKVPWDEYTAGWAAGKGQLHILEYLVERKYDKYDTLACERAASYGPHLDCLKYLHETAKAPWDEDAVWQAHANNQTNVYNTSSTTTALSQKVGDTKEEEYYTRTIPTTTLLTIPLIIACMVEFVSVDFRPFSSHFWQNKNAPHTNICVLEHKHVRRHL